MKFKDIVMTRVPKILRAGPRRHDPQVTGPLSDYPVAFAAALDPREVVESTTISRSDLGQLVALAEQLNLHCLPMIGLHGVTRLDNAIVQRLSKELELVLATTNEGKLLEAACVLEPVVDRVIQDSALFLLVAAGL